jgi:hypothetical protein
MPKLGIGISVFEGVSSQSSGPTYDAVTLAWKSAVEAAGGSVVNSINAVDAYVKGCKTDGIWAKLSSGLIIPAATDTFVGCFIPLVAPSGVIPVNNNFVASDYSLSTGFNPGVSNTTKSISTGFIPSSHLASDNSAQQSFYSRTNSKSSGYPGTMNVSAGTGKWLFCLNSTDNSSYFDCWDSGGSGRIISSIPNTLGLISSSRIAANDLRVYRNGSQVGSTGTGTIVSTRATGQVLVFAPGASDANVYENRICSYIYIGSGLTSSEEAFHYSRVQTMQTTLGRNV